MSKHIDRKATTSKIALLAATAGAIFAFAFHPVTTFDTFFGLKIGEMIVSSGKIPVTEPFSWSAQGRPIIVYEWLAQVWAYLLHAAGGLVALELYVASMLAMFFLVVFSIYRALTRQYWSSFLLALFTAVSVYDFFVARPQIIAFLAFTLIVYLIFQYLLHDKNRLYLTIPLIYIWTNSHASFVIGLGLLASYAVCGHLYWTSQGNKKRGIRVAKILGVWAGLNILTTILPPLGIKPYVFLWNFASDLPFMTQFISEWAPLSTNPAYQIFYTSVVLTSLALSAIFSLRNKALTRWYLAIPFLGIALLSFQAIRHVPFGIFASLLVAGLFLPEFSIAKGKRFLSIGITVATVALCLWLVTDRRAPVFDTIWHIPSAAVDTDMKNIIAMDFQGRMFNEFAVGGYMLYFLYPKYQIFFDGRADIYHCCEMREYWKVIQGKRSPQAEFDEIVRTFLTTYQFSYLIIPTYSYNPMDAKATMVIASVLRNPDWKLVYFSDLLQIAVKDDGKNQTLFDGGFTAVTPYGLQQWKQNKEQEATGEYTRMTSRADSAIARNALGELALARGQTYQAEEHFRKAIALRPGYGRSRIGLSAIAQAQGDIHTAISELTFAIETAPYLGEAYVHLGRIYIDQGQKKAAKDILEAGLGQNIDFVSLREMAKLLNETGTDAGEE